jgi:hypothetical protein
MQQDSSGDLHAVGSLLYEKAGVNFLNLFFHDITNMKEEES